METGETFYLFYKKILHNFLYFSDAILKPTIVLDKTTENQKQFPFDEAIELAGIILKYIEIFLINFNNGNFFNKSGNGKLQIAILAVFATSVGSVIIEGLNMGLILPVAKCDLAMTSREQGFINSVTYFGFIFTSHAWGFLADTWGRKKVLQLSLILCSVSAALSSFSVSTLMLLLTRFCVGLRYMTLY